MVIFAKKQPPNNGRWRVFKLQLASCNFSGIKMKLNKLFCFGKSVSAMNMGETAVSLSNNLNYGYYYIENFEKVKSFCTNKRNQLCEKCTKLV